MRATPDEPDILEEKPGSVETGRDSRRSPADAAGHGQSKTRRHRTGARAKPAPSSEPASQAPPRHADARREARRRTEHVRGARRRAAGLRRAGTRHAGRRSRRTASDWLHEIKFDGYRLQARARRRQGQAADPQRARLDRQVRHRSPRRSRRCRSRRRCSTASWWSRRDGRRLGFLRAAGRPQRRPQRPLRLLRVRPPASRRRRPARRAAARAQGRAGAAARRGAGRQPLRYSEHFAERGRDRCCSTPAG